MKTGILPRLLLVFSLAAVFFAAFSSKAFADNDTQGAYCKIYVNNVGPLPTNSSQVGANVIPAQSAQNQYKNYSVRACFDPQDVSSATAPGVSPVVSINEWNNSGWATSNLTRDGGDSNCFSGSVSYDVRGNPGNFSIDIEYPKAGSENVPLCRRAYAALSPITNDDQKVWDDALAALCNSFSISPNTNISTSSTIKGSINLPDRLVPNIFAIGERSVWDPKGINYRFHYQILSISGGSSNVVQGGDWQLNSSGVREYPVGPLPQGAYVAQVLSVKENEVGVPLCKASFCVGSPDHPWNTGDSCEATQATGKMETVPFDLCKQAATQEEIDKCNECVKKQSLWTAVGCVPTDAQGIVQSLLRIGLGLSGGVVILAILAGAFMFATSSGDTKKVQEAQEMISSAIIGLLFVIFSVIILQFVGISLLHIPGFGK